MASENEPRATPASLRLHSYTEDALKFSAAGPPWHRGIVALVSVLGALWLGHAQGAHGGLTRAPALAVFMTLRYRRRP